MHFYQGSVPSVRKRRTPATVLSVDEVTVGEHTSALTRHTWSPIQGSKFRNEISVLSPPPPPSRYDIFLSKFPFFYEFDNILFRFDQILFKILDQNFRNFSISAPSTTKAKKRKIELCSHISGWLLENWAARSETAKGRPRSPAIISPLFAFALWIVIPLDDREDLVFHAEPVGSGLAREDVSVIR